MGQFNKNFSCRRCRERKIRCNRAVPCKACVRHGCEDRCYPYEPPSTPASKIPIPILRNKSHPMARPSTSDLIFPGPRNGLQEQLQMTHHHDLRQSLQHEPAAVRDCSELSELSLEALHNHLNLNAINTGSQVILNTPTFSWFGVTMSSAEKRQWLSYLASSLLPRMQCDILISCFFENVNWIYQAIHTTSFMKDYESLWRSPIGDVDPIWVSLLFVMMSLSALYIDPHVCESFGLEGVGIREKAHQWFRLSRQALHVGEYESRPCLTQIQVFVEAQLYWYSVKAVEALNSALGQTIKCAQAIGLDKDYDQSIDADSEMRHRIWWEVCCSDIFQAFCLGRQPLIQVHLSKVPMPLNCDDSNMTSTKILPRPLEQPTRMSVHVIRARVFKALSKLFADNSAASLSYESVCDIDAEAVSIIDRSPWYMASNLQDGPKSASLPSAFGYLQWQHHIIHSSLCVQRIRMYRPFLRTRFRHACWSKCIDAVESTFSVYHAIRRRTQNKIQDSQKLLVQSYQIFCAAVSIAMFLLVEQPTLPGRILSDIEIVMQDLKRIIDMNGSIPMAKDGRATLTKILGFYHSLHADSSGDLVAPGNPSSTQDVLALAQEVYSHMGGTVKTLTYLDSGADAGLSEKIGRIRDKSPAAALADSYGSVPNGEASIQSPRVTSHNQFMPLDIDLVHDTAPAWMFDVHFDVMSWPLEDLPWAN